MARLNHVRCRDGRKVRACWEDERDRQVDARVAAVCVGVLASATESRRGVCERADCRVEGGADYDVQLGYLLRTLIHANSVP